MQSELERMQKKLKEQKEAQEKMKKDGFKVESSDSHKSVDPIYDGLVKKMQSQMLIVGAEPINKLQRQISKMVQSRISECTILMGDI